MKNLITGVIIAGVLILAYFMLVPQCPPKGKVLVTQEWIDSLKTIANTPPDTIVKVDTFKMPYIVYIDRPVPEPSFKGDTVIYNDEYKDEKVLITLTDSIYRSRIFSRRWGYQLFVPVTITNTITVMKPVPMPYEVIKKVNYKYYGGVDYGTDGFSLRGGMFKGRYGFGAYGGEGKVGVSGMICF